MTLFMEYDIVQTAAATSLGGTYKRGPIFDNSGVKIGHRLFAAYLPRPHKKKSKVAKSHDRGGHLMLPLCEINMPGNRSCRILFVPWSLWHEAPSCSKQISSVSIAYNSGHKKLVVIYLRVRR